MLKLHAVIFIETITKLVKVIFVNTMRGNTILIIIIKCFKQCVHTGLYIALSDSHREREREIMCKL